MPSTKKDNAPAASDIGDNWGDIVRIHEEHGLILVQGGDVLTLPPAIETAVDKVMNTGSWHQMKTNSAVKIIDRMVESGSSNEISILMQFWLGLHKDASFKSEGATTTEHEWDDVGLTIKFDQQFCLRGPSMLDITDPQDKKILDAIPPIQHPKPNITMGLTEKLGSRTFFDQNERSAHKILNKRTQITKDIFHPFAIWEQKKSKAIELAQVQALRGGSTLVWAFRQNLAQAKMIDLDDPGIDATNIAFSFAGNTSQTRIFVHYADVGEDKRTKYYMQEIREYSLTKQDQLKQLRSDLDHILDWGTMNRLLGPQGTRAMLSRIINGPNKAQKTQHEDTAGAASRNGII
ncbi:MAG: hypothetical protein Q9182_002805 [Xanthomendoza sp. 2 TL-2023]